MVSFYMGRREGSLCHGRYETSAKAADPRPSTPTQVGFPVKTSSLADHHRQVFRRLRSGTATG